MMAQEMQIILDGEQHLVVQDSFELAGIGAIEPTPAENDTILKVPIIEACKR